MLGWREEGELGVNSASLVTPPSTFLFYSLFLVLLCTRLMQHFAILFFCFRVFIVIFVDIDVNVHNTVAHLQITNEM